MLKGIIELPCWLIAKAGDTGSMPGLEDPLEKEMATNSSILPWRIPWTSRAGQTTVHGVAKGWIRLSR